MHALIIFSVLCCTANLGTAEGDDLKPCETMTRLIEERFMKKNPRIMDGPERPQCDQDGKFLPKQCLSFTGACWCSKPDGSVLPDTMTYNDGPLECCLDVYRQSEEIVKNNPGIQDGPWFPKCADDGNWMPEQCYGFTGDCWCVDSRGNSLPGRFDIDTGKVSCQ
ncbi:equistatin-like isoform X1 [Clavelina lepadiformis]|uniref:equistatin-like isoform X1 n=1 Tax=Clavelina lepadiformis TaxID=159417 RepID=UPI0040432C89